MEFEDFQKRVQTERKRRAQRDAAERNIPYERLRRELREAFARQDARELGENRQPGVDRDPI
jgi:hypothetical protein